MVKFTSLLLTIIVIANAFICFVNSEEKQDYDDNSALNQSVTENESNNGNGLQELPEDCFNNHDDQSNEEHQGLNRDTAVLQLSQNSADIHIGQTLQLWVDNIPDLTTELWLSSNSDTATVNSDGVVTGVQLGNCTIFCYLSSSLTGFVALLSCSVKVHYPDGVYKIKSMSSLKCLEVKNNGIFDGTDVQINQEVGGNDQLEKLKQMWKVHYLGDGMYSIRPMSIITSGLTIDYDNGNTAEIMNYGTVDYIEHYSFFHWEMEYVTQNAYKLIHDIGNEEVLRTYSVNNGEVPALDEYVYSTYCLWLFEKIENPPEGVILYKTVSGTDNVTIVKNSNNTIEVTLGDNKSMINDYGYIPVVYSPNTLAQTIYSYTYTSDLISTTGCDGFSAVSTGNAVFCYDAWISGNPYYSYCISVLIRTPLTYCIIRNIESDKYIDIDGTTVSNGSLIVQYAFHTEPSHVWQLVHVGNGYYAFKSEASNTALYLGVSNDSTAQDASVVLRSGSVTNGMQWRIAVSSNGNRILYNKNSSKAMAIGTASSANGVAVKQKSYTNNNDFYDEWRLVDLNIQLPTPTFQQCTSSWCWAASAQMIARTKYPTETNNGTGQQILNEQRKAVYHVFGDSSTPYYLYDWTSDPQNLNSKGGCYWNVADAAAYLITDSSGDDIIDGYLGAYQEEKILMFLNDGLPIARAHLWLNVGDGALNTIELYLQFIQNNTSTVMSSFHVNVIIGVEWNTQNKEYIFLVRETNGTSTPLQKTYQQLLNGISYNSAGQPHFEFWSPSVVYNTPYNTSDYLGNLGHYSYPTSN